MQVNTLIIGAGRSGTTTLGKILESHSQVCFSKIKEVHYFSIDDLFARGKDYYHSFFPCGDEKKIIASADTYLLPAYNAIQKIKDYNPDMKIIVMLRNPVDRAYSSYNYSINYGYHKNYESFITSIEKEKNIVNEKNIVQLNNIGHFYCSLYYLHLAEWLKVFDRGNFLFLPFNLIKTDIEEIKVRLTKFLGVDLQKFKNIDATKKHNANAVPKSKIFEQFLLNRDNLVRRIIRNIFPESLKKRIIHSNIVDKIHNINRKSSEYKPLSSNERQKAEDFFKDDLIKLKNITEFEI
jgi:hypothetical protein